MAKLKTFGVGDSSVSMGYTLPLLLGHLESLVITEEDNIGSSIRKAKRFELVQDAVDLLGRALEYEE